MCSACNVRYAVTNSLGGFIYRYRPTFDSVNFLSYKFFTDPIFISCFRFCETKVAVVFSLFPTGRSTNPARILIGVQLNSLDNAVLYGYVNLCSIVSSPCCIIDRTGNRLFFAASSENAHSGNYEYYCECNNKYLL